MNKKDIDWIYIGLYITLFLSLIVLFKTLESKDRQTNLRVDFINNKITNLVSYSDLNQEIKKISSQIDEIFNLNQKQTADFLLQIIELDNKIEDYNSIIQLLAKNHNIYCDFTDKKINLLQIEITKLKEKIKNECCRSKKDISGSTGVSQRFETRPIYRMDKQRFINCGKTW